MCATVLEKRSVLDDSLKTQIGTMMKACRESGDEGVAYPLNEDDTYHYLLWKNSYDGAVWELIGAYAVLPLTDESAECIAYVRPDERRRGYFSQVMLPAVSEAFPDQVFIFPVRGGDETVIRVLDSIGAGYDRTEYRMELLTGSSSLSEPGISGSDTSGDIPSCRGLRDLPVEYSYPPGVEPPVASCRLERISSDSVCLYGVEVCPEKRGQGYGTAMLSSLAGELGEYGVRRVILHVSSDNLPAVSLYEKTGFRTTETLLYYIF